MVSSVAVLGCGPAGLLVAAAVERAGYEPVIYSKKQKSNIPGSLHLRAAVPDVTPVYPDNTVTIVRMGTAEVYARKVYGSADRYTGWDNYQQVYESWNAVSAYNLLWERYASAIVHREISASVLDLLQKEYPLVISTLPQQSFCVGEHQFDGEEYWIMTLPTPPEDADREIIVYNGLRDDHWYRYSILGGICSIETTSWGDTGRGDWQEGVKPTGNNCNCHPAILRVGRWAEWRHGVLLTNAYQKAYEVLKGAKF
jgi:hypothetical protein